MEPSTVRPGFEPPAITLTDGSKIGAPMDKECPIFPSRPPRRLRTGCSKGHLSLLPPEPAGAMLRYWA